MSAPADPGVPLGDLTWPRIGGGAGGLVPNGATREEVIAFGGIPDPMPEERRMSARLQDQQDVDMKEGNIKYQFPLKKGMEHFPRKRMKLPFDSIIRTNYVDTSSLDNT